MREESLPVQQPAAPQVSGPGVRLRSADCWCAQDQLERDLQHGPLPRRAPRPRHRPVRARPGPGRGLQRGPQPRVLWRPGPRLLLRPARHQPRRPHRGPPVLPQVASSPAPGYLY